MGDMGFHYTPCRGGRPGGWLAAAVAVAVTVVAVRSAGPAVTAAGHGLALALEVLAVTAASAAGLAAAAGAAYGGLCLRRRYLARVRQAQGAVAAPVVTATVTTLQPKAIEPPREPLSAAELLTEAELRARLTELERRSTTCH